MTMKAGKQETSDLDISFSDHELTDDQPPPIDEKEKAEEDLIEEFEEFEDEDEQKKDELDEGSFDGELSDKEEKSEESPAHEKQIKTESFDDLGEKIEIEGNIILMTLDNFSQRFS